MPDLFWHYGYFLAIFMRCILLFVVLITTRFATEAQRRYLLLESTFEDTAVPNGWTAETCCLHSIQRSDSVARAGHYAIRFDVRRTDPIVANGIRSELRLTPERTVQVERWYGFSIFLPLNYVFDPEPEILAQWHDVPDFDRGETYRSPPIALFSQNGRWIVHLRWSKDTINTNKTISGKQNTDLGAIDIDAWTDWVFHIRFDWQEEGLIEIWKNGSKVLEVNGPNAYNDKRGPYFKLGVYKWMWLPKYDKGTSTANQRVVFYDEVRIGNEQATYADIERE